MPAIAIVARSIKEVIGRETRGWFFRVLVIIVEYYLQRRVESHVSISREVSDVVVFVTPCLSRVDFIVFEWFQFLE